MLRATIHGVMVRKARLAMSLVAVALSVAFVAGTFMFGHALERVFTDLSAGSVADVTIAPKGSQALEGSVARPALTPQDLAKVRAVPGVESAEPQVWGENIILIGADGRMVGGGQAPQMAFNWLTGPAQHHAPLTVLTQGREPRADDELAMDAATFARSGYRLGDRAKVISADRNTPQEFRVVGVFTAARGGYAGASVLNFTVRRMQRFAADGADRYHLLRVTVAPGHGQDEVRDRIVREVPLGGDLQVETGASAVERSQDEVRQAIGPMRTMLLVFAFVSVLVGAFLILNTFGMIVAQRTRELALFRALGASQGQVLRSVVAEAVLVGLLGSSLGIGLGAGLAWLLQTLITAAGLDMSTVALGLTPDVLAWGFGVGVGVTLLGALWPAVKGSRVAPVSAMSDVVEDPRRALGAASVAGGVLLAAGLGLALWAWAASGAGISLGGPRLGRDAVFGLGMAGLLIGTAILAPVLGRPVVAASGAVFRRAFGTVGHLARTNALRAPGRTAATVTALMIGVTLVIAISMLAATFKATVNSAVDGAMSRDIIVSGPGQLSAFSPEIARRAEQLPDVEYVTAFRSALATVDGEQDAVNGVETEHGFRPLGRRVLAGDIADFHGTQAVALTQKRAAKLGKTVGDRLTLQVGGRTFQVTVVLVFSQVEGVAGAVTVPFELLTAAGLPQQDQFVLVHPRDGVDPALIRSQLDEIVKDNPTVGVSDSQEYKKTMSRQTDMLLYVMYGLLGLAIIIAILGIVNTLALSAVERTREIGLLRAIGLGRGQVRRMVRLEAVVIALLGAVMGLGLGLFGGFGLVAILRSEGLSAAVVPWGTVAAMLGAAVVVGVLAALWPAWRASRKDVLAAIAAE